MVDEAKAFCPDCGQPFVDEASRRELTEHDSFDGTLKLSQSSYNIMLSQMELDITEQPAAKITPSPPAVDAPAPVEISSKRPTFIIAGAVLLLLVVAIVLAFFIAQSFSK